MTLIIALILLDMQEPNPHWFWYVCVGVIWAAHVLFHHPSTIAAILGEDDHL